MLRANKIMIPALSFFTRKSKYILRLWRERCLGRFPFLQMFSGPFKPIHNSKCLTYRCGIYNKCPSFSRFVFKYRSLCGLDFILIGTCSVIFRP